MRHLLYFIEGSGVVLGFVLIVAIIISLAALWDGFYKSKSEETKAAIWIVFGGGVVLAIAYAIGYTINNK